MAFDKVARDLHIPWSLGAGSPGAALEAFADFPSPASSYTPSPSVPFVVPMRNTLAFSFAGLRSALTRILVKEPVPEMAADRKRDLARAFIAAAVGQLEEKVGLALRQWKMETEGKIIGGASLGGLVVSGGVASNMFLRRR